MSVIHNMAFLAILNDLFDKFSYFYVVLDIKSYTIKSRVLHLARTLEMRLFETGLICNPQTFSGTKKQTTTRLERKKPHRGNSDTARPAPPVAVLFFESLKQKKLNWEETFPNKTVTTDKI